MQIVRLCWDLCLLRKGPQDFPYSIVLFVFVLLINALISFLLLVWQYTLRNSLLQIALMLLLTTAFTQVVLRLKNKETRFIQTTTALFASSTVISLLAFPLWLFQFYFLKDAEQNLLNALLGLIFLAVFIGLNIWVLIVTAHIFKSALEIPFFAGLLVTFGFVGIHVLISHSLGLS